VTLCSAIGVLACGAPSRVPSAPPAAVLEGLRDLPSRPPVAVVARDGDPRAALAVAVSTAGVDDEQGARVAVALAGVTEDRLARSGLRDFTVTPTWDGYRVRVLLGESGDRDALVHTVRDALLTPVVASAPEVDAAARKLAALDRRPLRDPALADVARCAEEPSSLGHAEAPDALSVERWRAASQVLGRVVFGVAGPRREIEAVTSALLRGAAWTPSLVPLARGGARVELAPLRVYDAAPDVAPGAARVTVVVRTTSPLPLAAAAATLGAAGGPATARLRDLVPTASLRRVTATASTAGGCLAVTVDVSRVEAPQGALATAATILRQEARLAIADAGHGTAGATLAALAHDPREAADVAAWWALVEYGSSRDDATLADGVTIGLGAATDSPPADAGSRTAQLAVALENARGTWQTPAVEVVTQVERGQGTIWLLLGSPCGTLAEADSDAGLTALAIAALGEQARTSGRADGAAISGWVTAEGAGLIAHAERHEGESPSALARRAADALGAAFMDSAIEPTAVARARNDVALTASQSDGSRAFATLTAALTPGHPSWAFPLVVSRGLGGWPDGAVVSRLAALRRGPLRVAILANEDEAQAEAAARGLDRWLVHTPGGQMACAPHAPVPAAKPGTYAAVPAGDATAWIALPIQSASRDAAAIVAGALDGSDGLLARALSSGLAYEWSAKVIGPTDASALVVHIGASPQTLDAAVAQVRGLFERLRQGAFSEDDRTRAGARVAADRLDAALQPRERLVHLWRGDVAAAPLPPLAALREFLSRELHDGGLVIVPTRPSATANVTP